MPRHGWPSPFLKQAIRSNDLVAALKEKAPVGFGAAREDSACFRQPRSATDRRATSKPTHKALQRTGGLAYVTACLTAEGPHAARRPFWEQLNGAAQRAS